MYSYALHHGRRCGPPRYRMVVIEPPRDPSHARSWPSFRLGPLNTCQGRCQAGLRVYVCRAPPPFAVVLRLQTGLTANLQGFRIRAPEGWPLLQRRTTALGMRRCIRLRAVTSGPTRAGRRRGPAGPKSGRPGGRERPNARKVPGQLRTIDAPRSGQCSRRAALCMSRRLAAARSARP